MQNKFILTLLLITISLVSHEQIHLEFVRDSKTKDFNEIVQQVEDYYKDKDQGKGSGYKQFKRWEYYNRGRLTNDGKLKDVPLVNFNEFYYYQERVAESNTLNKQASGLSTISGNWQSISPRNYSIIANGYSSGIGRVKIVKNDPQNLNIIYAATGGGLWRSETGGNNWVPLTDGIPRLIVSGVAIDYSSPVNNRTIYISTHGVGVLKSMDNGRTWYSTGLTVTSGLTKLKIDPSDPNTLYAAGYRSLYKTVDGGLSWTNIMQTEHSQLGQLWDIEFHPTNSNIVYVADVDQIYVSTNGGSTWNKPSGSFNIAGNRRDRIELAVTPANPNYVYAVFGAPQGDGLFSGVYRSTDSGSSFSLRSQTPNILGYPADGSDNSNQAWHDLTIEASPTNPNEIHVGGINTWRSFDGGQTWENTSYWVKIDAGPGNYTHADVHDLRYVGSDLYCASDGGVFKSHNNAGDWFDISDGLEITQLYSLALGTENNATKSPIYFGAQDNGLNALKDNSTTMLQWFGADGMETLVLPDNRYVLGFTQIGLLHQMYNETSTRVVKSRDNEKSDWVTPMVNRGNTVYLAHENVYRQTATYGNQDNGLQHGNWTNISNGQIGSEVTHLIDVAKSNNNIIYAVKRNNKIFKTTNGGGHWFELTNLPGGNYTDLTIHPTNANVVYLTSWGKVHVTIDGGNSWIEITGTLPDIGFECITHDNKPDNGLYLGTDVGVFYKNDALLDWIPFYNQFPNSEVRDLKIKNSTNEIYAATYGRGIWKSQLYGHACENHLNLASDLEGYKYYTANNISSTSLVKPLSTVKFRSTNEIKLSHGFKAAIGSSFNSSIDPNACSNYQKSTSGSNMSQYVGPLPGTIGLIEEEHNHAITDGPDIYIFPNPGNTNMYIQFDLQQESEIQINVYSIDGKLLISENSGMGLPGKRVEKLDVSSLPNGAYILECNLSHQKIRKSIVIKN